jgi:NitT/TauT family transport system ATP-binding protein
LAISLRAAPMTGLVHEERRQRQAHDIGEAIAMADRVLILSARPATVRALHVIDLLKLGRDPVALRTDSAFQEYFARIWADLEMPANVA